MSNRTLIDKDLEPNDNLTVIVEIIICRDIPGAHTGGRDCWCVPQVLRSTNGTGIYRLVQSEDRVS